MLLTTIAEVPGRAIEAHFGMVSGSSVRARNVVSDFGAYLKNLSGGELGAYTALVEAARKEAEARMVMQAEACGADAIVNIRFATSQVAAGAAEILVYGTAVKLTATG